MNIQSSKNKLFIRSIILGVVILLITYLSLVSYFKTHFYFKTTINGLTASGKTVDEFTQQIDEDTKNYILTLEGRDGIKSQVISKDINLKYNHTDEIKKLKDSQNPFNIFKALFIKKEHKIPRTISYDSNSLKQCVDKMDFFNNTKIVNPVNATIKYNNKEYEIIPEVMGNKVNKDILYKEVDNAIVNNVKNLTLEKRNCYENPKYVSKSQEVINAKDTMNKYIQSVINYDIRGKKKVVDSSIIKDLLMVDDNFNVDISPEKVKEYVNTLAYNYNTAGIMRTFNTSSGQVVKIYGGDYGWIINRNKEKEALVKDIKEGKIVTRKPIYSQTTPYDDPNEVGNSYVEIDLTKQHLWVYKNGSLVANGNIVTGNLNKNTGTPAGIYTVTYKEKNATLKGEDYSTKVTFWIPFNGGIGMHDASWRKEFGGNIYKNNGSHGCVNCPYSLAQIIYDNVQPGTPVVCYN